MANEITYIGAAGLTLTATLTLAGAAVGAAIAMPESGTVAGLYLTGPPGGTADGVYVVVVKQGAEIEGGGILRWKGGAEELPAPAADTTTLLSRVTAAVPLASDWTPTRAGYLDAAITSREAESAAAARQVTNLAEHDATQAAVGGGGDGGPTAGDVAAAVRAELAIELARVDVAVSSRNATAPDNAGITAIKAKTDTLPADPASQAAILAALDGLGGGTTGDLAAEVLGATAGDGTVLDAMTRINELPAGVPVQLVPAAPVDVALCRVYGYFSTPDGQPAAGVKIEFKFISPGFTRSARIVAGRTVVATTSKLGELTSDAGPFLDLLRTDLLTTPGVTYQVSSAELGVKSKVITLTTDTADLRVLLA